MSQAALLRGAVAGCIATVPMSVAMELMYRQLPAPERYPLPPSEITAVAEQSSLGAALDQPSHTAVTLAAHFGYGAAAGALYGPLIARLRLPPALAGSTFGVLVWTASYMGLLPMLGILKPATAHPPRRTALMIAAHLVWGVTVSALFERLAGAGRRVRVP